MHLNPIVRGYPMSFLDFFCHKSLNYDTYSDVPVHLLTEPLPPSVYCSFHTLPPFYPSSLLCLSFSAGSVDVREKGKPHACSARWCLLRYPRFTCMHAHTHTLILLCNMMSEAVQCYFCTKPLMSSCSFLLLHCTHTVSHWRLFLIDR